MNNPMGGGSDRDTGYESLEQQDIGATLHLVTAADATDPSSIAGDTEQTQSPLVELPKNLDTEQTQAPMVVSHPLKQLKALPVDFPQFLHLSLHVRASSPQSHSGNFLQDSRRA